MKKFLEICFFLCVVALLPGSCAWADDGTGGGRFPEWTLTPPADDAGFMYGAGEGSTASDALRSALTSINGRIATVVDSSISSRTSLVNGTVSSAFTEEIRARTMETRLSGYEIVRSAAMNGRFFVLVRLPRALFVNDTKSRLATIDGRIASVVASSSQLSNLQCYRALLSVRKELAEATNLVYVLMAVDPGFQADPYLERYRACNARTEELLSQLHFSLAYEPGLKPLADVLIGMLGEQRIAASWADGSRSDAYVVVRGDARNSILFSEYHTTIRVTVQLLDVTGNVVNSREYTATAASLNGYEAAISSAMRQLESRLRQAGPLAAVGLDG